MHRYTHVKAGQARVIEALGHREEVLSESAAASVFLDTFAKGVGVPMHRHAAMDEGALVLEGAVKLDVEGEVLHAGPGDYFHVPRGLAHGFVATEDARLLWVCTPGGYTAFFEDLAKVPVGEGGPDFPALAAVAARYQTEVLGPPPAL